MDDWKTRTISLANLRQQAQEHEHLDAALPFLVSIGLAPDGYRTTNWVPSTNLDPDAIPAKYLAAVAYEWDGWGPSKPEDFADAIAFECRGTVERENVVEVMMELLGAA